MAVTSLDPRANPELFGQDQAVSLLHGSWRSGRAPHAWLLFGRHGIGKATLAFRFGRALLAGAGIADSTLSVPPDHPVFRLVAGGAHPDLRVIEAPRDARSGRLKGEIPVDLIRQASAAMHTTAAQGGHRVVIVDGAELLNRNAANALLKPLEEPPPDTTLILVTHHLARVLPTLRSRCAKLRLDRLPDQVVEQILARQGSPLELAERTALARMARGSAGFALELVASDSLALYRKLVHGLSAEQADRLALQALASDLARHADAEGLPAVMALIQELLGRALRIGLGRPEAPVFADEAEALARMVARRPLDRWAGLWEKIGRLSARADAVNLDRSQVLWQILDLLASAAGSRDQRLPGSAPLGGQDALG